MSTEAARLASEMETLLSQMRTQVRGEAPPAQHTIPAMVSVPAAARQPATNSARAYFSAAAAASNTAAAAASSSSKQDRMREYIAANRNPGTAKSYASGWAGFALYLGAAGLSDSSFDAADVADYLRMRVDDMGVKYSTLGNDRAAISDRVKHGPLAGITNSQLVVDMMHVLKTRAEPSQPKQHVSAELMRELIDLHEEAMRGPTVQGQGPSWLKERNIFLLLAMMMGMLRESEAVAVQLKDCHVRPVMVKGVQRRALSIAILRSKTDQEGKGQIVLLVEDVQNPRCCPVKRYEKYMEARGHSGVVSQYLFPRVDEGPMATGTPNKLMKAAVENANKVAESRHLSLFRWGSPDSYGSHSLRRGGVTVARANGVPMLDIQRHGRWKSLTVFAYVGTTESERIAVTDSFLQVIDEEQPSAASSAAATAGQQPEVRDDTPSDAARALRAASKSSKKRRAPAAAAASESDGSEAESGSEGAEEAMERALFDESIDASDEHSGKKKQKDRLIPSRSARHTGESRRRRDATPAKPASKKK
jgi:hypothetical protein